MKVSAKYIFFGIMLLIICFSTLAISKMDVQQEPELYVLGIAQDAGYPQAGCQKICCKNVAHKKVKEQLTSCLALIDKSNKEVYFFDATPDFKQQLNSVEKIVYKPKINFFLTHAHIGHYTGLMHLGREAMGAYMTPVYAMPRMKEFLKTNGPWSQLVKLKNIYFPKLTKDSSINIYTAGTVVEVEPFEVPHRDEFSETVGYKIYWNKDSILYIPDIDKWSKWDKDIVQLAHQYDKLFIDGTFYDGDELPNRNMAEIPHPFVVETMALFKDQPRDIKQKINFIHLNHTNPLLNPESPQYKYVIQQGFKVAKEGLAYRFDVNH